MGTADCSGGGSLLYRHRANACGSPIPEVCHLKDTRGRGPVWGWRGSSCSWGRLALALLVWELVQLALHNVSLALCRWRMSRWSGIPAGGHVRWPSFRQSPSKEAVQGLPAHRWEHGHILVSLKMTLPCLVLMVAKAEAACAFLRVLGEAGSAHLPLSVGGLRPGMCPRQYSGWREGLTWACFSAAKPEAELIRGCSQRPGLREVGPLTTSVAGQAWSWETTRRAGPRPIWGVQVSDRSKPHPTSFVKATTSRNQIRKSWLVSLVSTE